MTRLTSTIRLTPVEQPQKSNETPTRLEYSSATQSAREAASRIYPKIAESLKRLCAFHATVELTPFVIETWCAALSVYRPEEVNRAILEVGLSIDPFPSVGKIIDKILHNRVASGEWRVRTDRKPGVVPLSQVREIAEVFGVDV